MEKGEREEREVENSVAFHTVCERNGVQKPKLQDVQLEARLDERRDCQRRQQKALPLPLPRPSFLRGFLPTLRNGLRAPLLSLLFDPFNDRGRGFYKEIIGLVYKWYDCRCNYRDVIISYYLEISVSRISLRFFDIGDYSCVLIFFFLLVFWIYMKVYIEYLELIIFKIFERCFMIVFHNLHHIVYYIF